MRPDAERTAQLIAFVEAQIHHRAAKQTRGAWCEEWAHPASWLNGERWTDELSASESAPVVEIDWREECVQLQHDPPCMDRRAHGYRKQDGLQASGSAKREDVA